MLATGRAQVITQERRVIQQRADSRAPCVEHAKWTHSRLGSGIFIELSIVRDKERLQLGQVGRPALGAANRVEIEADARGAERIERRDHDRDQLGVDRRIVGADRLGADLRELPQSALLRLRVAEHRRRIAGLEGQG